jgi:Zn-dependent peptidase ImmA (M78 family)
LFIEKARQVLRDTGLQGPAYDPFKCAERLGIKVEEKNGMSIDGLLKVDFKGKFIVFLKGNNGKHRKNFTLAHEISHTFFYDILNHPINFRSQDAFDPEEERLCDIGAAELLMPEATFRRDVLLEESVTPQTLFWLVGRYNASLQAVANRLTTVTRSLACIFWRKQAGMINTEYVTPWFMKRVTICETGNSSIELAFDNPGEMFSQNDSFYGVKAKGLIRRETTTLGLSGNRAISIISLGNDLFEERSKSFQKV